MAGPLEAAPDACCHRQSLGVKLSFLTTDDPIYLPAFFDRVLARLGGLAQAVYVVPPLYRGQTPLDAVVRYARTFGLRAAAGLTARVVGTKLRRRSIAAVCRRHGVVCESVADVNAPGFLDRLRQDRPDALISVSCPQLFKQPLTELPRYGILNIHGALLPQYRGVMPSFWMMKNGERTAGVTIYFVDDRIDAGQRCAQRAFAIRDDESLDQLLRRSKAIAADLLLEVIDGLQAGSIEKHPMDLTRGSYYSWPDREAVREFREAGRRIW